MDYAERKHTEAVALDPLPEPRVRLFLCGFNWCLGIVDVRIICSAKI
jgi:hypothetical protein